MLFEDDRSGDELLATRCQLGEVLAFDELVARWHEPLWKYLRRLTGDDDAAAESIQDLWLRVLRGIPRLRDGARLRTWMFSIARRVVMDRLREKYAQPSVVPADEIEIQGPEPSNELEEDLGVLHDELARMPVTEREVLVLFYLNELRLTEMSEVLGVPVGTVKSRLFRAREILRRQLERRGVKR
jgi:RNA polymerase sigma factor (sigma-70 family)